MTGPAVEEYLAVLRLRGPNGVRDEFLPAATALVAHHFRRVLLEIAQSHLESVGEPAEIAAALVEARKLPGKA